MATWIPLPIPAPYDVPSDGGTFKSGNADGSSALNPAGTKFCTPFSPQGYVYRESHCHRSPHDTHFIHSARRLLIACLPSISMRFLLCCACPPRVEGRRNDNAVLPVVPHSNWVG